MFHRSLKAGLVVYLIRADGFNKYTPEPPNEMFNGIHTITEKN